MASSRTAAAADDHTLILSILNRAKEGQNRQSSAAGARGHTGWYPWRRRLGAASAIMYQVVIVAVVLCFLFKVLNVNNSPAKSLFYSANAKFLEQILQRAPSLNEP